MKALIHFLATGTLVFIIGMSQSWAGVKIKGCKDASGVLIFTTMSCEEVREISERNQAARKADAEDDSEDYSEDEIEDQPNNTTETNAPRENEIDPDFFNEQVAASLVPENTVVESDDFLQELDPDEEGERIPEYDEVIVEYALPGITEDECCLRVIRGTQHSAEKICLSRGKAVWRLSTINPKLDPQPPIRVNNTCHIQITGKADSEYLYSCRTRAIAKCFWD